MKIRWATVLALVAVACGEPDETHQKFGGVITPASIPTVVSATSGGGVAVGGTTAAPSIGLLSSCGTGNVLAWNGSSWACAAAGGGVSGGTSKAGAMWSGPTSIAVQSVNDQELIGGPTWQSFAVPNSSYTYGEINRTEISGVVPAYPADLFLQVLRNSATADCTTHDQRSGGLAAEVTGTRSAGTNSQINVAIECTATGGQVNNCFEALSGDVKVDQGNFSVAQGTGSFLGSFLMTTGTLFAEGTGAQQLFFTAGAATDNLYSADTTTRFNVKDPGLTTLSLLNSQGTFNLAMQSASSATQLAVFSPVTPTSVSHGTLGTGSTNLVGNVTGVGAFTSVVLTYSTAFAARSWCQATVNASGTPEFIAVTNSASAPTFACFNTTTGAAANCVDFTYQCIGQ